MQIPFFHTEELGKPSSFVTLIERKSRAEELCFSPQEVMEILKTGFKRVMDKNNRVLQVPFFKDSDLDDSMKFMNRVLERVTETISEFDKKYFDVELFKKGIASALSGVKTERFGSTNTYAHRSVDVASESAAVDRILNKVKKVMYSALDYGVISEDKLFSEFSENRLRKKVKIVDGMENEYSHPIFSKEEAGIIKNAIIDAAEGKGTLYKDIESGRAA